MRLLYLNLNIDTDVITPQLYLSISISFVASLKEEKSKYNSKCLSLH